MVFGVTFDVIGICLPKDRKPGHVIGDAASAPSAPGRVRPNETEYWLARKLEKQNMEQETLVPILKPCPFCGDRPQIVQSGTFAVQCADCGAMGPPAPNMERAAVRWNKRKGDDFGW